MSVSALDNTRTRSTLESALHTTFMSQFGLCRLTLPHSRGLTLSRFFSVAPKSRVVAGTTALGCCEHFKIEGAHVQRTALKNYNLRAALLIGTASAAVISFGAPASAQDQTTETVVVTGSRI